MKKKGTERRQKMAEENRHRAIWSDLATRDAASPPFRALRRRPCPTGRAIPSSDGRLPIPRRRDPENDGSDKVKRDVSSPRIDRNIRRLIRNLRAEYVIFYDFACGAVVKYSPGNLQVTGSNP